MRAVIVIVMTLLMSTNLYGEEKIVTNLKKVKRAPALIAKDAAKLIEDCPYCAGQKEAIEKVKPDNKSGEQLSTQLQPIVSELKGDK